MAIHLQDEAERKRKPEFKDFWIDIGANSRAQAEEIVSLGDVATFQYEFQTLLGDRATARGFDNKMGAFVVAEALRLLKKDGGLDPKVGVYAVATVQEEIGIRGVRIASFSFAAQTGLAVDVNNATNSPGLTTLDTGGSRSAKAQLCLAGRTPTTSPLTDHIAAREEKTPIRSASTRVRPGRTPTSCN